MNESTRTITYVVVAAVAAGLALVMSPPTEITPESLIKANVGKEFYKDFKPTEATSIRVVAYDESKALPRAFGVKFDNGKWTIPSHHNYPADGADRLAKTAASTRGIKREELASTTSQNHEQLGVVDPLDEDKNKTKGRGQRFTLNNGDTVLVDLILGKQLKDRPGFFYIRKPGEDATYVAKVSIDLSTKFSDWVETDLLKLDRNDLTDMKVVMNFQIENANGRPKVVPGETNSLTHEKSSDPWKLDGLQEGEEVDVTKVTALVAALDDLKLVGVRPKPKGFKPDLSFDREYVKKQSDLDQLVRDLHARGFELVPDLENKVLKLYGDEGELTAATSKGIVYTLKFGSVFLGDETEIEIGAATDKDEAGEKSKDAETPDDKDKAKATESKTSSRYLFVTAGFEEKYLGPAPEKPTPPDEIASALEQDAKPKGEKAAKKGSKKDTADDKPKAASNDKATETKAAGDEPEGQPAKEETPQEQSSKSDSTDENCFPVLAADDDEKPAEEKKSEKLGDEQPGEKKEGDEKPAAEKGNAGKEDAGKEDAEKNDADKLDGDAKPQPAPKEEKKKTAEELKREYDGQLKKYESDLKAHQDKVAAGKKQAGELNARFSGWYYVISAENFSKLHLSRKELVKEKGKPAGDKQTESEMEPDEEAGDPVKDPLESLDDKDDAKQDDGKKDDGKKDTNKKDEKGAAQKPE